MKSRSLFGKIFAVYGVTFTLMVLGFVLFRLLSETVANESITPVNLSYYAELLTDRIGTPPDRDVWEQIQVETGLIIRIEGPAGFLLEEGDADGGEEGLNPEGGWVSLFFYPRGGEQYLSIPRGDYTYVFSEFHGDFRLELLNWLVFITFLLAAVTVNYLLVRHILGPLRRMTLVTGQFGRNDWKARVNPRGKDELALLGREIDDMADRIEGHMNSLRDLLYGVSHEFRSPLTRMKILLELTGESRIRTSLAEEIDFLDRMTGALLEQKRLGEGRGILEYGEYSLNRMAGEFVASQKKRGTDLEWSHGGGDFRASFDRTRLLLAMSNLVENARKYAPGGPICLETGIGKGGESFFVRLTDTGPGVSEDILKQLGTPFLRSGKTGGFGLGLSLVKGIADAHGGQFIPENLSPRGFRVTLELPLKS